MIGETQRKMEVSLSFLKGPKRGRAVRLQIMDDVSGQTIAVVDLDPAQFTGLVSGDVLFPTGHTSRVIHTALAQAQDC